MNIFEKYDPLIPQYGTGVLYLRDQNGLDWYESQSQYREDTIKMAVLPGGMISVVTMDISAIVPEGQAIFEFEQSEIPADFQQDGSYICTEDGKLIKSMEFIKLQARDIRDQLLALTDKMTMVDYPYKGQLLDDDMKAELFEYREALRHWPDLPKWPLIALPKAPAWIAEEQAGKLGVGILIWPPHTE